MTIGNRTVIGFLGGREARAPHFDLLQGLFPAGVTLDTEPLSLWRDSDPDPAQAEDTYVTSVVELVRQHQWQAVALTGTPNEVLYPGALERIRVAVGMPTTASLASSVAALRSLAVHRVLLLTPFDETMNQHVHGLLAAAGFETVLPRDAFGSIDEAAQLSAEDVYTLARNALEDAPGVEGICFQGARLDPLAVLERLEGDLNMPVVSSNPAMLWKLLSEMGQHHSIEGGGRLLREWPA